MADSTATTPKSRTMLVTYLGALVRPLGGWMPIGGTVELMTQVGLDAQSVRTAVFRLTRRGWLVAESRAGVRGYALTPTAVALLAKGDEIVWHARTPADLAQGWCIVHFSVPESARAKRHQLRAHLTSLGFGNVGAAVWIAPARMRDAAVEAVDELGLTPRSAVFVGDYSAGPALADLMADAWDMGEIDRRYCEFLADFAGPAAALGSRPTPDPAEALVTYLSVIDRWRTLPYRDPGLPPEVLPAGWSGQEAGRVFETLVARLEAPAREHACAYWPTF